ncbi:hypothetical protein PCASD_20014 [Puccinia coronata f. sp. avenae]|uniref:Uncharacterized protein n=1 Tax=Puccinia coronata f. sp. avenae TaxID=200324 RepID=A0A2N5TAJ4_9BASI|nr:hypothetical protein PCASD_20014 [Puccinia coronata f. sp. avenae]
MYLHFFLPFSHMILRFKTKRVSLHPPSITAPTNALTQLVTGAQPEVILPLATPSFLQPLRDCVAPESSDLMLMILDKIDQLELEIAYPIGHSIARSEIHSRTTSTALESNWSTPIPHLVERQQLAFLRREAPPCLTAGSTKPTQNLPLVLN